MIIIRGSIKIEERKRFPHRRIMRLVRTNGEWEMTL